MVVLLEEEEVKKVVSICLVSWEHNGGFFFL